MTKLLLTTASSERVHGGVEVFSKYLKQTFPDLEILSFDDIAFEKKLFKPLKEPLKAKYLCNKAMQLINELKPEVIFTNGLTGFALEKNKINVPIINICHGTYSAFADNAIKKLSFEYLRTRFIYSFYEKKAAENADIIIANSKFTQENIKKYYNLESTVIYNGIDTSLFDKTEKEKARELLHLNQENIVLFVGRPDYAKGFDIFKKLSRIYKEVQFVAVTFPKAVDKKIKCFNSMPIEKLALFYSAADFFIMPSRFEGFGFVSVEAAYNDLPMIASKTGILKEVNFNNTITIDKISLKAFSDAFNQLKTMKFENSNKKLIEERFSLKTMKKEYENLIKSL